jgi:predicted amidohydrolase YtcJ
MIYHLFRVSVAILVFIALIAEGNAGEAVSVIVPQADTVFLDGRIVTVDGKQSIHQAIAVKNGRLIAVGKTAAIKKYIGVKTRVIQLKGKMVIPGIIQTHSHAIGVARQALLQPHVELNSVAEVQKWIRKKAKQVPKGEWIHVPRADITRLMERRHPTPAELDAACNTHPIAFRAARKWVLNTKGIQVSGILKEAKKKSSRIRIIRDEKGNPRLLTGVDAVLRPQLPSARFRPEKSDELKMLVQLLKRYNSVGITSIFERASSREGYDTYRQLHKLGKLPVRVTVTMRSQMKNADDVKKYVAKLGLKPGEGDEWVKAGPLKVTVDGGIHWGNTYLREAYGKKRVRFYALDDPEYRGDIRYTAAQMAEVFATGHQLGWQMCCHVTGDAGVDRVLQALEIADRKLPVKNKRFTLVHAYFPAKDSIRKAKRLGVCVDTQADLYFKDSNAIAEIYGKKWAERFIGIGDWIRGGIPTAINGDHMMGFDPDKSMNSFNPFLHLYVAVSRRNNSGIIYGAHQKVSRMQALTAMTKTAAYLSFDEKHLGSLEPGKRADIVVLNRDYLTCQEKEIRHIKPLLTMVGGKVVYELEPVDLSESKQLMR